MSRKFKTAIPIVVCIAMMATLFAGCQRGSSDNSVKTETTSTVQQTASADIVQEEGDKGTFPYTGEVVVFKGFSADLGIKEKDNEILAEYRKRIGNVKVEWQLAPWADYATKLKLFLNSGDVPDILWTSDVLGTIQTYSNSGIFLDYEKYKDSMPNLQALKSEFPYLNYAVNDKNERFGLYELYQKDWSMEGWFYNETVLNKHGIKVPETAEEFFDACLKLKSADPNCIPYLSHWQLGFLVGAIRVMYGAQDEVQLYYDTDVKKMVFWSNKTGRKA